MTQEDKRADLLRIVFAYLSACLVSGFLLYAMQMETSFGFRYWIREVYEHRSLIIVFVIGLIFVSGIPAIFFTIYARIKMIRSLWFYLIAPLLVGMVLFPGITTGSFSDPVYWGFLVQILFCCICAGFTFWLIAGRRI